MKQDNRFLAGTATDIGALARAFSANEVLVVLNYLRIAIERYQFDAYTERVRAEILQGADVLSAYEFAAFDILGSEIILGG